MAQFITSLPVNDNAGNSTVVDRLVFFQRCRMDGIKFDAVQGCHGIWYGDDGVCYSEEVVLVTLTGNEQAIRRHLASFGSATAQLAMLMVEVRPGHIVEVAQGRKGAEYLARKHGGATLTPRGTAFAYDYNALEAGKDYRIVRPA